MKKSRRKFSLMELSLVGILAAMFVIFSILNGDSFYSAYNILNILKSAGAMAIMVLGLTWVLGAGEFDCSFPEVASCASMVFAYMLNKRYDPNLCLAVSLLTGVGFGLINSLLVVKFKFYSLIATIATSTIAGACANIVYKGSVLSIKGINSKWMYKFFQQKVGPLDLPMVFVVAFVLFAVALLIQEKTRLGQYIYALAENPQAVKEGGIKDGRVKTIIFVFSSFMAAFGGIVYVLTVYKSGQPNMGSSFFLNGFTCVFLGSMVLKLGKTHVVGTLIGTLVLATLTSGLTMQGAGFAVGQVIKGLLLILGVSVVTIYRRKIVPRGQKMKYE